MKIKVIAITVFLNLITATNSLAKNLEVTIQTADWCSPCIRLKKDLAKQGSEHEIFLKNGKSIPIIWDDYSDFGKRVRENKGKISVVFPTYIIKKNNRELSKINSMDLKEFIKVLELQLSAKFP